MQESRLLPTEIRVRRSADPIYMAHGYLTKVPVAAIVPFIEAFTQPGELILDPFAGSGMTGVAAVVTGRRAILSDISRLGQHIALNYVNLVDPSALRRTAAAVIRAARSRVRGLYEVPCAHCGRPGELVKAVWSQDYVCSRCGTTFTYYRVLKAANWRSGLHCPSCGCWLERRSLQRVGETMVLEAVLCPLSTTQREQEPMGVEPPRFPQFERWPDFPIEPDREMFRRSALARHGLTSTAAFFSRRNLTALVALRDAILSVEDDALRSKLMFAFTAIVARASKRYQWSLQRPLNAQNQTYYISPVFYEWNVFDLFERKVEAAIASDDMVRGYGPLFAPVVDVTYHLTSADDLWYLPDNSVDYVFTDPPFGSNIFYSDMNLFQEAWLGEFTDRSKEAVIATSIRNGASAERYEGLLTAALQECHRVLKPGRWLSMVFSNSRGDVWAMAQRALKRSGLELVPERLSSLDKGQRSIKGLASGWEGVVTSDLVLSARKPLGDHVPEPVMPAKERIEQSVAAVMASSSSSTLTTPSRVYLAVIQRYLERHWDLEPLHFGKIIEALDAQGYAIEPETAMLAGKP